MGRAEKPKENYQPTPAEIWLGKEKKTAVKDKAEAAAEFLESKIWNNKSTQAMWEEEPGEKIITEETGISEEPFNTEELNKAIKKLKKRQGGRTGQYSN